MGNTVACFVGNETRKRAVKHSLDLQSTRDPQGAVYSSSSKKETLDDPIIREQALAAAALFRHHQQNGSLPQFDRSTSVQYPLPSSKKQKYPRSSSSRPHTLSGSIPHQLVDQCPKVDGLALERKQFVLVHGGGFGAWCWYKTLTLLEEAGFETTAVDLTGSGIHSFDPNSITSLALYAKPLVDLLEKLQDGKKVFSIYIAR